MSLGSLKDVQNQLDVIASRSKAIENDIKKLDSSKKDKDKKSASENVLKQISQTIPLVQKLQERLTKAKKDLEGSTKKNEEQTSKKKTEPSIEDTELTYELKAQVMKNIQVQNDRLKMELALQEKVKELKLVNQQNSKLQQDCKLSQTNTMKLVQMFEKKAREASLKLEAMQEELKKSQELTNRYRDLYDSERQKQRTTKVGAAKQSTKSDKQYVTEDPKGADNTSIRTSDPPNSQCMLGHGVSVNDVIRRNQNLVIQNNGLQKEIAQLKKDNHDLMKRTKESTSDRDGLVHQLNASEKAKEELSKKLQKEKLQKQQMEKSMTKQASDWIQRKKQVQQYEDEYRWSQVGYISQNPDPRIRSPYKSY